MTTDLEAHRRAKALVNSVDEDADGKIDFQGFLRMMRSVQDDADEDTLKYEAGAIKATKFEQSEVKEFRNVFQMFDGDSDGELTYTELVKLLGGIVPLGHKASKELVVLLRREDVDLDKDGSRDIDFPEFLSLMRCVLEEDWAGINSRSAALADGAQQDAVERKVTGAKEAKSVPKPHDDDANEWLTHAPAERAATPSGAAPSVALPSPASPSAASPSAAVPSDANPSAAPPGHPADTEPSTPSVSAEVLMLASPKGPPPEQLGTEVDKAT